jgi:hypothetical protein
MSSCCLCLGAGGGVAGLLLESVDQLHFMHTTRIECILRFSPPARLSTQNILRGRMCGCASRVNRRIAD